MKPTHPAIAPLRLDHLPDIRLIACDMDGTLLDDEHVIHDDFWPLIGQLSERGVLFCPASGRQYNNLLHCFGPVADELAFIAENGCLVMYRGQELSSDCVPREIAHGLVRRVRALQASGMNLGIVLCGKGAARIERHNPLFVEHVERYYLRLEIVDDLLAVDDDFLKIALYDPESSERNLQPHFAGLRPACQVVVSGQNWLDIMPSDANKGSGLRHLQQALGVSREQTMVFGDFLNDLEMMDEAAYSFAMANAHPLLKARASHLAPANTENGVVRTIRSVLRIPSAA